MSGSEQTLILASGSGIRRQLLEQAGFRFRVDPADLDEAELQTRIADPRRLAVELAQAKARAVAPRHPGALVLGSDQVFSLDGRVVAKPEDRVALAAKLRAMSGRTHRFDCGFALVRDQEVLLADLDSVEVDFHRLGEDEIAAYVALGEGLGCAGGYRLEERGLRFVKAVRGNQFTVYGLPMIPLMGWLRDQGLLDGYLKKD
ncbi:MAG: septum formation protein Maf [Planctomycetes bacterium]|nr:septum formation protein Maf [Planctomycetota bacterium]